MGISIYSHLMQGEDIDTWRKALKEVGEEYSDVDLDDDGELQDLLYGMGLDSSSPDYDCDVEYKIFGKILFKGDYGTDIDIEELKGRSEEAYDKMMENFGIKTKIILCTDVY
ncbi:hypothetical protein [Salmonella phage SSBI34]|nr:hypothetical protein [Salmonella phage SSBI34]